MSAIQRFNEAANDALVKLSEHCLPGTKLALVIYTPGEPERDIVIEDQGLDRDEVVSALRRRGLTIDGDNVYKRDLLDSVVGALAFGAQNNKPPPPGHWGQRFWDIGRETAAENEGLRKALAGMLFAFDDRVGLHWSADLLNYARKLCPAAEFKQ